MKDIKHFKVSNKVIRELIPKVHDPYLNIVDSCFANSEGYELCALAIANIVLKEISIKDDLYNLVKYLLDQGVIWKSVDNANHGNDKLFSKKYEDIISYILNYYNESESYSVSTINNFTFVKQPHWKFYIQSCASYERYLYYRVCNWAGIVLYNPIPNLKFKRILINREVFINYEL